MRCMWREKCHWCIVAIVKTERFELNRYRGIPQKRSVESSCIGWFKLHVGETLAEIPPYFDRERVGRGANF